MCDNFDAYYEVMIMQRWSYIHFVVRQLKGGHFPPPKYFRHLTPPNWTFVTPQTKNSQEDYLGLSILALEKDWYDLWWQLSSWLNFFGGGVNCLIVGGGECPIYEVVVNFPLANNITPSMPGIEGLNSAFNARCEKQGRLIWHVIQVILVRIWQWHFVLCTKIGFGFLCYRLSLSILNV